MTRFRFNLLAPLLLAGCTVSSGVPAAKIADPGLATAYIPLHRGNFLSHAEGAAVAIAPGIAVTNSHNRNLVTPDQVIGASRDYDLLFFRDAHRAVTTVSEPKVGEAVTAYGQGANGGLRRAQGAVRSIWSCPGCTVPAYFSFAGDAGPGFSGGPVLDPAGRLIGIVFGYKVEGQSRRIYAYPVSRVRAELSTLRQAQK